MDGGDLGERFEYGGVSDVAQMKYVIDTGESGKDFGSQQAVGIADDTDLHRVRLKICAQPFFAGFCCRLHDRQRDQRLGEGTPAFRDLRWLGNKPRSSFFASANRVLRQRSCARCAVQRIRRREALYRKRSAGKRCCGNGPHTCMAE